MDTMRANMLKQFEENDLYRDIRKSTGWKDFKKKYYGDKDNSCS